MQIPSEKKDRVNPVEATARPHRRPPPGFEADIGTRCMPALLRAAFPGRSPAEITDRGSMYLGRSKRTLQNWQGQEHDARLGDALRLVPLIGWERFMRIIEGRDR